MHTRSGRSQDDSFDAGCWLAEKVTYRVTDGVLCHTGNWPYAAHPNQWSYRLQTVGYIGNALVKRMADVTLYPVTLYPLCDYLYSAYTHYHI